VRAHQREKTGRPGAESRPTGKIRGEKKGIRSKGTKRGDAPTHGVHRREGEMTTRSLVGKRAMTGKSWTRNTRRAGVPITMD